MDGGVPIKAPVAGIAMGLVKEGDQVVILSDILGDEDHTGDMDFKVAGTREGITALQMDIKIHELSRDILEKALEQAGIGRLHILDKMLEAIKKPRKRNLSLCPEHHHHQDQSGQDPRHHRPGRQGDPGHPGRNQHQHRDRRFGSGQGRRRATRKTGMRPSRWINEITMEPEVGAIYEGTVVKIMDFGAFVQIMPGTDGLVHISQLARERVTKVRDVVKEGDTAAGQGARDRPGRQDPPEPQSGPVKKDIAPYGPANQIRPVLDNGVRILTRSMPHVRSVSMGVWVNAGARDETAAENGLSHLIEHMIFKGTRRRSAYQIAKEFDAIGGQTNAFTSMENTCYHAKVMDTHLPPWWTSSSDIFLNSVFDSREMERERPVILQEIGMVEDSPDEYVHLLAGRNFWGDHPLGRSILGTRESVAAFDRRSGQTVFRPALPAGPHRHFGRRQPGPRRIRGPDRSGLRENPCRGRAFRPQCAHGKGPGRNPPATARAGRTSA